MGPVKRGCGFRQKGGAYAVTNTSPFGKSVEEFIIDPPRPIDTDEAGLSAQGVMPFAFSPEQPTHVMNWLGSDNYPNVADFVEEVRRYGASSRIPKTFDFSLLSEGSYIYHVHSRAYIDNFQDYLLEPPLEKSDRGCPSDRHSETDIHEMCARLWWQDITDGKEVRGNASFARYADRICGDTKYVGWSRPPDVTPVYRAAVFMRLPVHKVEIVADYETGKHEEVEYKASSSGLNVQIVDF